MQPKDKTKINNQQKVRKKPYVNKTHGYKMTINDNKEDLNEKAIVCHKLASDGGALTMMCRRNEEP
jgi:hypothetical protein